MNVLESGWNSLSMKATSKEEKRQLKKAYIAGAMRAVGALKCEKNLDTLREEASAILQQLDEEEQNETVAILQQ